MNDCWQMYEWFCNLSHFIGQRPKINGAGCKFLFKEMLYLKPFCLLVLNVVGVEPKG